MAPDAKWIAAKIFNDSGAATTTGIHLAFQWLLDPDGNPATADAPNVVNASWTMSAAGCNTDFQPDLQSLRAAGIPKSGRNVWYFDADSEQFTWAAATGSSLR
mgnify:CR=1 FL=1